MATLKYIGTPAKFDVQTNSQYDIATQGYVAYLLSLNMTMPQVTTQINAALTPYATKSYADSDLASLATPAYAATLQANYITFGQLNQPNGPIEIQKTGTIAPGQINLPSTQTLPDPFWSPRAYNTSRVSTVVSPTVVTPQNLYTISIPDPGYTYVVFCSGLADVSLFANTVQTITINGLPTGGTWTVTDWNGETTSALAFNATATNVQTAIAALTSIGSGNVAVTGAAGGPYTVTFISTLAVQSLLDANSSGLTGGIPWILVQSNGASPSVVVRRGSTTGQIVAAGYGLPECYRGPLPGQKASQMTLPSGTVLTGTMTTLGGWVAINDASYSTQVIGSYMQIQQTLSNVTLSASITFSGAAPSGAKGASAVTTGIQIVTNNGTIVATGTAVVGNSGVATVSWTGNVTVGTLYGLQAGEASAVTFGTITKANLTMTPGLMTNSSTANILPIPYDQQLSVSGTTTLYPMLVSSDGETGVRASTFNPALWVMPIPWTVTPGPPKVTLDSASNGVPVTATSISWQQILGIHANCLLVGVGTYYGSGGFSGWTRTATCQGIGGLSLPMTSLGVQNSDNANSVGWCELFVLQNPPTGPVTITVTETNAALIPTLTGISVAYQSVATVGVASPNFGASASLSTGNEASSVNGMVVGLVVGGAGKTVSATTGTSRAVSPVISTANTVPAIFLDSPGTGSNVNLAAAFNAVCSNSSLVVALSFT